MNEPLTIPIQRLANGDGLALPQYKTDQAAGMDICAAEDTNLSPNTYAQIATGFAIALPQGHEAQIRPRSGLAAKHGITILNAPGTIDSDYRGEVKILLINHGTKDFAIKRGDRIAQMVIAPIVQAELQIVDALDDTARGADGFGSTGIQAEETD